LQKAKPAFAKCNLAAAQRSNGDQSVGDEARRTSNYRAAAMTRRRTTTVLALLALALPLAAAPAALAQGQSPFSPLPPPTPQQTVTQSPTTTDDDGGIETWQAALIVAGAVVLLGAVGIAIARDARRRAPAIDPRRSVDHSAEDSHHRARRTKQRQRQRGKAARAARRKNR
jgi:hypothetical protein